MRRKPKPIYTMRTLYFIVRLDNLQVVSKFYTSARQLVQEEGEPGEGYEIVDVSEGVQGFEDAWQGREPEK